MIAPSAGFPLSYWSAPDATLYLGDACACLRGLPTRSVHCVVTSPPYWGLRDYETGTWEGGDQSCDHNRKGKDSPKDPTSTLASRANNQNHERQRWARGLCGKCGAIKSGDAQIGAEPSPDCGTNGQAQCGSCFVCSMVEVFREVHRVLRDDGTAWLNLGDTYGGKTKGAQDGLIKYAQTVRGNKDNGPRNNIKDDGDIPIPRGETNLPSGNLVGVPWRVALALQADGWVLRQDIIWYAPNKMPESVTNRCTKSHEYIFLLAKGNGYYFDSVAIAGPNKELSTPQTEKRRTARMSRPVASVGTSGQSSKGIGSGTVVSSHSIQASATVNKRDVWTVATHGYPGAHYATFSPQLITPCILAGTSEHGCCAECGRPYERVVVKTEGRSVMDDGASRRTPQGQAPHSHHDARKDGLPESGSALDGTISQRETVGWRRCCGCRTDEVVPAMVLDPFVGSGTTVATALQLGRRGVGIDLSETYLRENAVPRIEATMRGEKVARRSTVTVPSETPPTPRRLR